MSLKLSVIICTHNPRSDYLRRVLKALSEQTLLKERWEMLLIRGMPTADVPDDGHVLYPNRAPLLDMRASTQI